MNWKIVGAFVLGLILGVVAIQSFQSQPALAAQGEKNTQWRYKFVLIEFSPDNHGNKDLAKATSDGWEFAGFSFHHAKGSYVDWDSSHILVKKPK